MNTGQTVYEQLQEMLNKCIELGFQYNGLHIISCKIHIVKSNIEILLYDSKPLPIRLSVHGLFSIDSGLMEFVEWYDTLDGFEPNPAPHYIRMSMLTAEMKCNYFVKNAIIPTK